MGAQFDGFGLVCFVAQNWCLWAMRSQFEVLIVRVTSIRTTDLAAKEETVDQQDDNHEMQRPTDLPVQVDESPDVSDLSILLVIARYLNVNEVEENLLLCYPLTKRCTGDDICNAIQCYFCENEIDWAKCCGVCTDGGKSKSGCYKGLRCRIKIVAPHVTWSHCCIHRQSLAAKPLPKFIERSTQSICQSCKFH
ncbi:Zinc finger BED domain-containing protein 5 [Araneus ventricosus]|uniref:Zinc finger BED domain-containing protein 5 n=1 Tax=Araneus ventricosus TaxID=182803 RepID=A0A4Y2WBV0_ARAVE|nr:Zinc finger BED domain-containing protein 5 [Araneus ventricosus]